MRALLLLTLVAFAAPAADKVVLAVVVDKNNPRNDITSEELRALFLGEQREWADGARAVPLDLEAGSPERELFNSEVLGLDQSAVDQHWVDQRMRGNAAQPKVAPSGGSVVKLAGKVRGVVGYVPLSAVDASVKVLKVDGIAPGKPGYALEKK